MTRRLLVLDSGDPHPIDMAGVLGGAGDEWGIVLFGDSPDLVAVRAGAQLGRLGRWHFVPLDSLAAAAHEAVAAFVPDFVHDLPQQVLGRRTLGGLLGHHWWFLETSERSPFRGTWIGSLYRLEIIARALTSEPFDEIVVAVRDAELRSLMGQSVQGRPSVRVLGIPGYSARRGGNPLLRHVRNALLEARRLLATLLLLRLTGIGGADPEAGALAVHTTHPYFWLDAFGAHATERFLPALPSGASYLGWIDDPQALWRRRATARSLFRARRIAPIARWLGLRDVFALVSPTGLIRLARFHRLRASIRGTFRGHEIGGIVADDLERSLASSQLFFAHLMFRAMRRFARRSAPSAVLYRLEFQPWESAIVLALRGLSTSVGFRHTPFGPLYLPVRLADGDTTSRPLPDRIIVSGAAGAARLRSEGYPSDRVAIAGPQRHPALLARAPRMPGPAGPFTAYVAISTVLEETAALIGALVDVSARMPDLRLIVRTHPALRLSDADLAGLLSDAGLSGRWSLADGDLYAGLRDCHTVVTVPSTLAFEALALGIMPVVFENPGTYNANSVAEHADAFFVTRSASGLTAAFAALRDDAAIVARMRERWPALIEQVFADLVTPLESQLTSALSAVGVRVSNDAFTSR